MIEKKETVTCTYTKNFCLGHNGKMDNLKWVENQDHALHCNVGAHCGMLWKSSIYCNFSLPSLREVFKKKRL